MREREGDAEWESGGGLQVTLGPPALVYFGPAACDFWFTSVNYMSPTLNIKPNQRLIIDATAFYARVPLVLEASGEELFLH